MKYCPKCKKTKPRKEFYPAPQRGDGLRSYCKECTKLWNKTKLKDWYRKRYREDIVYRLKKRKESNKFYKLHPEIRKAELAVYIAIKNKIIFKEKCQICGEGKTEAHHKDYSKPLEVVWLCGTHHKLVNFGKLQV